jgi:hypothetical protein
MRDERPVLAKHVIRAAVPGLKGAGHEWPLPNIEITWQWLSVHLNGSSPSRPESSHSLQRMSL